MLTELKFAWICLSLVLRKMMLEFEKLAANLGFKCASVCVAASIEKKSYFFIATKHRYQYL